MEALVKRFCAWSENHGNTREIWRDENGVKVLYLKRHYVFRCKWFEIMVHQFFRGDTGEIHNHPTYSFGRILVGEYYEWLCDILIKGYDPVGLGKVHRKAGFFNWTSRPGSDKTHCDARSYHKVELREEDVGKGVVYTLFVMGKRNNHGWSFWSEGQPLYFLDKFKKDGTATKQSAPENWGMGFFPKKIA